MNKEFAWFLGWLLTDGSITRPTYRGKGDESHIQFCLHVCDEEVLYKIKTVLQTRANVKTYPTYQSPQCKLRVYDRKDIVNDYADIKKHIPKDIEGYERHFIRGLVEGDGCLHYRESRKTMRINFLNQEKEIVDWVILTLHNHLGIPIKEPQHKPKGNVYLVEWEGRIAKLIAWWLFHGDIEHMSLTRKKAYYHKYVCPDIKEHDMCLLVATDCTIVDEYIKMHTEAKKTLQWAHIMQKLLVMQTTPIFRNKGQQKYYELYIHKNQIANTQDQ